MELNQVLKARRLLFTCFIAIFCGFWLWLLLLSNVPINTKGWAGYVMLILDGLYVMVLPLLGIATVSMACMAALKRSALFINVITIILVAAVLGFVAWSLSPSGQIDLRWTK